ncbi:MAG: fused MFS/spermidine synthase, partial [Deltaproteobacteria bacterium]|nr:fused MFS/spermidine synthase [Deltaproteobacteria bacterium]
MERFIAIAVLFFFSGLSSLILETVWTRQLVLVFGSTTFAISSVLTAFMAGLAGGSLSAGRRVDRLDRAQALRLYSALELVVGLYALLLPWAFELLPQLHVWLWGVEARSYHLFALLRFLLVFVLLAPPTFAMGATLPVLTQALMGGDRTSLPGRAVGGLYAVNTAGAVGGVFVAGFVLLPAWGTRQTTIVACLLDMLLAVVAFALAARVGRSIITQGRKGDGDPAAPLAPGAPAVPSADLAPHGVEVSLGFRRFALVSIAISGAVAMAYEVAWTRALTLVVGSSTYAFSLILIAFLLGLAGGAALYARRQVAAPDQGANLTMVHLLTALTALATTAIIDKLPAVLLGAFKVVELSSGVVFVLKFVVISTVVLLPALFMGMVLPAVVQIWSSGERVAGRAAGVVYGVNTLGAIVGSFLSGFVLVPFLGLQRTLALLVTLGAALAIAFSWTSRKRWLRPATMVVALLVAALSFYRSG